MKIGFRALTKLLAVCLSLSLLGGYIWLRQAQAEKDEELRQAARELARLRAAEQSTGETFDFRGPLMEGPDEVLMSSSKNPSRVMMPSSKVVTGALRSGDFVVGNSIDDILAEPSSNQELEDEDRVLLPGSKHSGTGIDEVPKLEDIPIIGGGLFKGEKEEPKHEEKDSPEK